MSSLAERKPMASGVDGRAPLALTLRKPGDDASEVKCWSDRKLAGLMVNNLSFYRGNTLLMLEIQKKILKLRDILDLPLLCGASMVELLMVTAKDLQKFCPDFIPSRIHDTNEASVNQGFSLLFEALKFACTTWGRKTKQTGKSQFEEVDLANNTPQQLDERILDMLDQAAKQAREFFDLMEQGEQDDTVSSQSQKRLDNSLYDRMSSNPGTPRTPRSVLPEKTPQHLSLEELTKTPCSSPLLWTLRLQAVGKLRPIDVKFLSFHASTPMMSIQNISPLRQVDQTAGDLKLDSVSAKNIADAPLVGIMAGPDNSPSAGKTLHEPRPVNTDSAEMVRNIGYSHGEGGASADSILPLSTSKQTANKLLSVPMLQASETASPQPLPLVKEEVRPATMPLEAPQKAEQAPQRKASPPPPPPLPPTKGSVQLPMPPASSSRGPAPPPPPPLGVTKALRAKKPTSKLKRSTHMGNLYRILKGRVEGSVVHDKSPCGRRNQIGGGGANKAQGMADALAEMTKRSSYFRQIEEDIVKHGPSILEMKFAITSFKTSDMKELIKFHRHVEQNLENLTDETQVLSRFEGFPSKKLESIRMASSLYSRLEAMAANLQNWKTVPPVSPLLDKVESYFCKIKEEVDAIERNKEEELKLFQSHNINFDFNILIRIKELMVDLSSGCMELVLKERRKQNAATTGEATPTRNGSTKMLWKAFQLAFRVYNFAGGQDDRADMVTRELAHEIETSWDA